MLGNREEIIDLTYSFHDPVLYCTVLYCNVLHCPNIHYLTELCHSTLDYTAQSYTTVHLTVNQTL